MRLSAIVAVTENGVIGQDNDLPWHLPADLRYFKRVTLGKPVIMGRKTWESLDRPLPGRLNIVVSRQKGFRAEGAEVYDNLADAVERARARAGENGVDEVMVVGGAGLYAEAMPLLDRFYLTRIHTELKGDTRLTGFEPDEWRLVEENFHASDTENCYACSFLVYER